MPKITNEKVFTDVTLTVTLDPYDIHYSEKKKVYFYVTKIAVNNFLTK